MSTRPAKPLCIPQLNSRFLIQRLRCTPARFHPPALSCAFLHHECVNPRASRSALTSLVSGCIVTALHIRTILQVAFYFPHPVVTQSIMLACPFSGLLFRIALRTAVRSSVYADEHKFQSDDGRCISLHMPAGALARLIRPV